MTEIQERLLHWLGIVVGNVEYRQKPLKSPLDFDIRYGNDPFADLPVEILVTGEFRLDPEQFDKVAKYVNIMQRAVKSDNPAVKDQLEKLEALVKLTR